MWLVGQDDQKWDQIIYEIDLQPFINTMIAQLPSEVKLEIFRNQIYFSFFFQIDIFESKKKNHWKVEENTMMRSAL